jgi:hypothetical protein
VVAQADPLRFEGGVGGLEVALVHDLLEHVVDPPEDGVERAEVLAQGDDGAAEALPRAVPEGERKMIFCIPSQ